MCISEDEVSKMARPAAAIDHPRSKARTGMPKNRTPKPPHRQVRTREAPLDHAPVVGSSFENRNADEKGHRIFRSSGPKDPVAGLNFSKRWIHQVPAHCELGWRNRLSGTSTTAWQCRWHCRLRLKLHARRESHLSYLRTLEIREIRARVSARAHGNVRVYAELKLRQ